QSMLLTELKDKLFDLVRNVRQTGLSDSVLTQLSDKAKEKTAAQARRLSLSVRRQFGALGFNLPPGDEILKMLEVTEESVQLDVTENRNIYVTNAQLEQSNFQFAFMRGVELETQLMNLHNSVQQRLFEAA